MEFKWNSHISSTLLSSSDNNEKKAISLLIPTYINEIDRLNTFKRAIESIASLHIASQLDCVIVDNSEHWIKEKKDILESSGLAFRYYKNDQNIGAVANWNRCVELAQQDVVTFAHDDDYLLEGFSNFVINYAPQVKEYSFIMSKRQFIRSKRLIESKKKVKKKNTLVKVWRFLTHAVRKKCAQKWSSYLVSMFYCNHFGNGLGALIYRDFIFQVNGFDESYEINSDYHLGIKLNFLKGPFLITDDTTSVVDLTLSAETKNPCLFEVPDYKMKQEFILLTKFPRITKLFCFLARELQIMNNKHYPKSISSFFGIKYLYGKLICVLSILIVPAEKA